MEKLMKAMHKNEKGFTLVELMVVVVIIGVLVAIAIPLYLNIVGNANRNTVESNLRIIDGAIQMYRAEEAGPVADLVAGDDGIMELVDEFLEARPVGPDGTTYRIVDLNADDEEIDEIRPKAIAVAADADGNPEPADGEEPDWWTADAASNFLTDYTGEFVVYLPVEW